MISKTGLNILSHIFDDTTNSYKLVFFHALLRELDNNFFPKIIDLNELAVGMLCTAWYPAYYYKLNHGDRDQLIVKLRKLNISGNTNQSIAKLKQQIRKLDPKELEQLKQYVPYRLIRVFFSNAVKDLPDQKINDALFKISSISFDTVKPLYRFIDKNTIEIHPCWLQFFRDQYPFIRKWMLHSYAEYLEKLNPYVSGIIKKIEPPNNRQNISSLSKLWRDFNGSNKNQCIFTNKVLRDKFDVDHYLPWSYVTHNEIWNTIPLDQSINRSKSNMLPPKETLAKFIETHYKFFKFLVKRQRKEDEKYLNSYFRSMKFETSSLSKQVFQSKMNELIKPMLLHAESMGFIIFNPKIYK